MRSLAAAHLAATFAVTSGACTQPQPPPPAADDAARAEADAAAKVEPDQTEREDRQPPSPPPASRKLNPGIAGVGTQALEATFPARAGGLARSAMQVSAAGTAGMWADSASAIYGEGSTAVRVHVGDMIRVSACEPGSWDAHLKALDRETEKGATQAIVNLGKHRAHYIEVVSPELGTVRALNLRLGDRCALELTGDDVTKRVLVSVAGDLGLDGLESACAKRDPGGNLGP